MKKNMIIVGAGLAGLSAALQAVKEGCSVKLISSLPSERAQSVMAEGGINAALNTKGEDDSTQEHYEDTIKAGSGRSKRSLEYDTGGTGSGKVASQHRSAV